MQRLGQSLLLALVLLLGVAAVFAAELGELSPWAWWPLRGASLLFAIRILRRAKIVQDRAPDHVGFADVSRTQDPTRDETLR